MAFLLTIAYVPGFTGTAIPTGWAFMSATLPFATWREIRLQRTFCVAGVGFLGYAIAGLAWAPNPTYGIFHLWQLGCIAGAFVLGSQLKDLRPIAIGLGLGLTISSAICVLQWFGFSPVLQFHEQTPSGLMYNSVALGTCAAIVFVWLVSLRIWWLLPGVLPSLLLTQSRGAWVAVAAAAALARFGWFALILLAGSLLLFAFNPSSSDSVRLALWAEGIRHLSFLGAGAGAMDSLLVLAPNGQVYWPEHMHSEYLDFLFHFGLVGLLAISLMLVPLIVTDQPERWPYVTFLVIALYSFPLHVPIAAFAAAVLAGNLSRSWSVAWADCARRRPGFFTRPAIGRT